MKSQENLRGYKEKADARPRGSWRPAGKEDELSSDLSDSVTHMTQKERISSHEMSCWNSQKHFKAANRTML